MAHEDLSLPSGSACELAPHMLRLPMIFELRRLTQKLYLRFKELKNSNIVWLQVGALTDFSCTSPPIIWFIQLFIHLYKTTWDQLFNRGLALELQDVSIQITQAKGLLWCSRIVVVCSVPNTNEYLVTLSLKMIAAPVDVDLYFCRLQDVHLKLVVEVESPK